MDELNGTVCETCGHLWGSPGVSGCEVAAPQVVRNMPNQCQCTWRPVDKISEQQDKIAQLTAELAEAREIVAALVAVCEAPLHLGELRIWQDDNEEWVVCSIVDWFGSQSRHPDIYVAFRAAKKLEGDVVFQQDTPPNTSPICPYEPRRNEGG